MNIEELASNTQKHLLELGKREKFDNFLLGLRNLGPTALVGGAIRDWSLGHLPRDLDFTVDCDLIELKTYMEVYDAEENHFGGFKIENLCGTKIDLWPLKKTWAFLHETTLPPTFENWLKTPFFNIDSIVYLLDSATILEGGFIAGFQQKQLDIIYQANPLPLLCLVKIVLHQRKYGLYCQSALVNTWTIGF